MLPELKLLGGLLVELLLVVDVGEIVEEPVELVVVVEGAVYVPCPPALVAHAVAFLVEEDVGVFGADSGAAVVEEVSCWLGGVAERGTGGVVEAVPFRVDKVLAEG